VSFCSSSGLVFAFLLCFISFPWTPAPFILFILFLRTSSYEFVLFYFYSFPVHPLLPALFISPFIHPFLCHFPTPPTPIGLPTAPVFFLMSVGLPFLFTFGLFFHPEDGGNAIV
jgi:hypothetical protein